MNVIRLLPSQISKVWNEIKFATLKTEHLSDKDAPLYFNRLLHSLLSSKAQCFVGIEYEEAKKRLDSILITRITVDEVTGEKVLFINALYSFQPTTIEDWTKSFGLIRQFAIANGCKKISTYSSNPRIFAIAEAVGFVERFRNFTLEV